MPKGSTRDQRASNDALAHDDPELSIETVIASLQTRSTEDREALRKALFDGDHMGTGNGAVSGLELTSTENKAKAHFMHPQSDFDPDTHPVSGTIRQCSPMVEKTTQFCYKIR